MERRLILQREAWRRKCQRNLDAFAVVVMERMGRAPAPHHRLLIRELQDVIDGRTPRLMINLPPGSAKSTYGSVIFPAFALARKPGLQILAASNTASMAETFSRSVMATVREHSDVLGYRLMRENAERWTTTNGGVYRAAGIGGAIAGTRAGLIIIDDPVRSAADADSETVRENQWNWFTQDARTRTVPNAGIVVIMTRWHQDDLGGRLIERQPGMWRVVSVPAQAVDDDPLGRAPGEWLWDGDPSYPYAENLRRLHAEHVAEGNMRGWNALFQGNPLPAEGSLFKVANIRVLDVPPDLRGAKIGRGWDLAATAQTGSRDPDWTCGVKMARRPDGGLVVLDVFRDRGGPERIDGWILNTSTQDRHDHGGGCRVSIPQDPGAAGKMLVLSHTRLLTGFAVQFGPDSGSKETRASPVASQVNAGNVSIVRGPWNRAFLDELAGFPNGTHDDQVDALSRVFGLVGLGPRPLNVSSDFLEAMARR